MKWTIRLKFYLEAALRDESCTPREWIHLLVSVGLYCLFLRMLPLGASTFKNWAPVTQTYYLLNKIREAIPSGHLDLAQLWVIVSTFRLRTTPCPLLAKWLLSLPPPPFSLLRLYYYGAQVERMSRHASTDQAMADLAPGESSLRGAPWLQRIPALFDWRHNWDKRTNCVGCQKCCPPYFLMPVALAYFILRLLNPTNQKSEQGKCKGEQISRQ